MSQLSALNASLLMQLSWNVSQTVPGVASPSQVNQAPYGSSFAWKFGSTNAQGQINGLAYFYGALAGNSSSLIDLRNIPATQSNFGATLAFTLINLFAVELLPNADASQGSSGIQIQSSGLAEAWTGWFGGGYPTIDTGGVPYIAGSNTGKPVGTNSNRYLEITNLDSSNYATIRMLIGGIIVTPP
jgi:hypothetical protein